MIKSDLTICSVVYNDSKTELFDFMVRSVNKYSKETPNFIICDNGGNNLDKYRELDNFMIVDNTKSVKAGSLQHGESLNLIFPLVKTKKVAIIEPDCIILNSGWDEIDFPKHKMIASKKGEQAGQTYYHVCFIVASHGLLNHNGGVDFRPGRDNSRSNRSYKPHEDVGWAIRDKVRTDEVLNVDFIDCKSWLGKIFDGRFQSDEFHLYGTPIVAHFGRGAGLQGKAIRDGFASHEEQLAEWKKIVETHMIGA
jgi:hypothetical protein